MWRNLNWMQSQCPSGARWAFHANYRLQLGGVTARQVRRNLHKSQIGYQNNISQHHHWHWELSHCSPRVETREKFFLLQANWSEQKTAPGHDFSNYLPASLCWDWRTLKIIWKSAGIWNLVTSPDICSVIRWSKWLNNIFSKYSWLIAAAVKWSEPPPSRPHEGR